MTSKEKYALLDKLNLCHRCEKARPAPGKKFCFTCLDKKREENEKRYDPEKAKAYQQRRREIYQEKKLAGICVRCKKPATHGIYCYECSIKVKRRNAEKAERRKQERHKRGLIPEMRKDNGLCMRCGKKLSDSDGKTYCHDCMIGICASLDKAREKSSFRSLNQKLKKYKETENE